MSEQVRNPFEDDQPKIVHLEKNESHYEACRMQMHDINRVHRRTFFCNMVLCIVVCMLAMFHQRIAGFDILSGPFAVSDNPIMYLGLGIFQIIIAMIVILLGYLAWANFHTLNLLLVIWYGFVAGIGIYRLDYLSAVVGAVGIVFYLFSVREMQHEAALAQMEGYPDFQEKFDISKSDIVIQTLMAHRGERRSKPSFFSSDNSLRRKKKKLPTEAEEDAARADAVTDALADELRQRIDDAKQQDAQPETGSAPAEPAESPAPAEMTDIAAEPDPEPKPAEDAAPEQPEVREAPEAPAAPKPSAPQQSGSGGKKKKKKK